MWGITTDLKNIFGKRKPKKIELWEEWKTKPGRQLMFQNMLELDEEFALACTRDITETFIENIKYAISNDENIILMIEAPQGEGKSSIAIWILFQWMHWMKELKSMNVKFYFTFNQAQTQNLLPSLNDGDIILQDEATKLQGRGAITSETELQNLVETMRFTRKSIIICSPKIVLLPGMTMLLRPFGKFKKFDETKNLQDMKSRVLWYQLLEKTQGGIKFIPVGYAIFNLQIIQKIEKQYLEAKRKNYRKLEKNRGGSSAQTKDELKAMTRFAKRIFKIAFNHGWPRDSTNPSKKALIPYIMESEISLSRDQEELIKTLVIDLYWKQKEKPRKPKPKTEDLIPREFFKPNVKAIIEQMRQEGETERDLEIYEGSLDPLKTGEEYVKKYQISPERVRQIKFKMKGKIAYKIGKQFEAFLEPHLKEVYEEVHHGGGIGEPDFICFSKGKMFLYSVKCLELNRGSNSISYQESHPEIEYARRNREKKPIVVCYEFDPVSQKIFEYRFDDLLISNFTPYKQRTIVFHPDQFSRDPVKDPWVIIPV